MWKNRKNCRNRMERLAAAHIYALIETIC